jgi:hypothetical protein
MTVLMEMSVVFLSQDLKPVFFKLWSGAFRQVIRGGPQMVSEEKALQTFYQTPNE